ncbi:MAG: circadian clock protein KaiC [Candidatus Omnitrophica bacterium]|nr:circadian clock protein KaiC [Candidatus Omnitrophota bacterium]
MTAKVKAAPRNQRIPVKHVQKTPTGIEGFEHVSMGGIPKGRTTLLSGTSGSGKTIFAIEYLWKGAVNLNEPGVFVTFEETPKDIIKNVKSLGWDLAKLVADNKFAFVDASPAFEEKEIIGTYDFSALLARIEYAIKKVKATRVAMDSISALFPQYSDEGVIRRELFRISARLKSLGVTTLLTAERLDEYGPVARFGVEEFVSDNVMLVRNILEEEKRRRTIEILKFRGALHQKGEYPFTITNDGINILPLSAIELQQRSSSVRISSGDKDMDKMCGGGFFRDSIILISGATGTGKTLSVTTFVNDACKKGQKAMLFALEESREQLGRNAKSWGMDFNKWEKKGLLKIYCEYPETAGLEDHLLNMKREIEIFNPSRIAVDSLSAMERTGTIKSFREFVIGLTAYTKSKEIAGLFTNTTPTLMGGESITETHISTITDSIILFRYVELHGEMKRGITVIKMRGSWHDKEIREFIIDNNGMHIGEVFKDVENIMIGSPRALLRSEREQMDTMMGKSDAKR